MAERILTVALAGNPNVGKSTLFNGITGLKQHTGNWAGKTVGNALGEAKYKDTKFVFADIPGTYSLFAHSPEEEVARDYICFENPDWVVVVCDATCLERNLNLVMQTLEITKNVVVCVNLIDEAERKNIKIDIKRLSNNLGVPVIPVCASKKKGIDKLLKCLCNNGKNEGVKRISYVKPIESAVENINKVIEMENLNTNLNLRWLSVRLLENSGEINEKVYDKTGISILDNLKIKKVVENELTKLKEQDIFAERIPDLTAKAVSDAAHSAANSVVTIDDANYLTTDRKIDRILTGRLTGIPIMALLLGVVFWITIYGANIPSELISEVLFAVEDFLLDCMIKLKIPGIIYEPLIFGVYRVLAWVVSVMLPPMAIFFPLFTILEDLGYLPRIAFNLDKVFEKCRTCGKQALTMCMGFGCNAVGVTGARIIDSGRERLIAILTNCFVPCNGRFPFLAALISMFFVYSQEGGFKSVCGAAMLTVFVMIGILMTFAMSNILSKTLLKGVPSSFTLELPPYRKPKWGQIIIRSVLDRTVFVLGRAVMSAAPAGLLIWVFANVSIDELTLLSHINSFFDPFARLLGMDGVILFAFILGLPANEIVLPIIIMSYMTNGNLTQLPDLSEVRSILIQNGWNNITAVCTMIFSLFHWPCATTLMTIKKETGSMKWTLLSLLLPTMTGMIICFVISCISNII